MDIHLVPRSGRNYTGFVTKTIVYAATLVVFLTASVLTISSIILPRWISFQRGTSIAITYGLHVRCISNSVPVPVPTSSPTPNFAPASYQTTCSRFPQYDDCTGTDRRFCSMWRTIGFLMSFAVLLEGMTLITYIIILSGGKQIRESGWRILTLFLVLVGLVQCSGMAVASYLHDNDDHFYLGFRLDDSFILCTVSWCLALLCALSVYIAARVLPTEGGYELIPDPDD
ncbi:hypothetical protein GX48_07549 [Paracoccidioides brasiliensis]|nr:hypothetical protein GX48_07549 [Paracoccidioides brasiliensis]